MHTLARPPHALAPRALALRAPAPSLSLGLGLGRTPLHPSALCGTLTTGRGASPGPHDTLTSTSRHPSHNPRQVFTTAIFAVALLGRQLHTRKWLALLSLTLGAAACDMIHMYICMIDGQLEG